MLRLTALAGIVLLAAAQDPADKVKALVGNLGNEELLERDAAAAELAKLGPPAIPAIRSHLAKVDESLRDLLKKVIRRIERDERVASLSRPGPRVTLSVKDWPVPDIFAQISKQTGVAIRARQIPAGARLTIEFRNQPVAAAIDDVCRAHGGLGATWSPTDVIVEPGSPRTIPAFDHGPFRFIVDRIEFKFQDVKKTRTGAMLRGGLVGPRERFPDWVWLDVERAEDDQGCDLGVFKGPGSSVFASNSPMGFPLVPEGDRIFDHLSWHSSPAPEATKVKVKGAIRMNFTVDFRTLIALKDPTGAPTSKGSVGAASFEIRSWARNGAELRVSYRVIRPGGGPSWKSGEFERASPVALEDKDGRQLKGRCLSETVTHRTGGGDKRWEIDGELEFTIPKDFEFATLNLLEPAETYEMTIPFELKDVPLSK